MFKPISSCILPLAVFFALAADTSAADRPNVIVMLVDDMGVMDTSVPMLLDEQGKPKRYPLNDFYRTPSMEQLAKRGVCFSNFQAMNVCSPTRVSIMTGQNAARHRTTNWINPDNNNRGENGPKDWNWKGLDRQSVTLARALQANGYRTIHVGKGHFGPRDSEGSDPKNVGFDVSIGGASIGQPGSYLAEKKYGKDVGKSQHAVPDLEDYYDSGLFLTEALTRKANDQVTKAVQDGKPFFLYFAQYAVHSPFDSDPRFSENYAKTGKPKNAQAFATLIEGMDKSLGDVMAHVRELGVEKDTLIVFLGDNGSDCPLGEAHNVGSSAPLRGRKGSHYEGGTRVPFIAAWCQPDDSNLLQQKLKIQPGTHQSQMAAVYDLFPTILEVTDTLLPAGHVIDGRSLRTLFAGKRDPDYPEQFLMHYPHAPHRSDYFTVWRNGDWKLIYHYLPKDTQAGHVQLFNLKSDPFEQTDLAKSRPAEIARLIAEMIEQLKRQLALMPEDKSGQPIWPKVQNQG